MSHNLLLIAGAIGLMVILGGVVAVVFVRHKQAKTRDESGYQFGSAVYHNRPAYAGYGQNFSGGTIAAEQDPWPWARKPSPPIGYNPITPVPEMLRTLSSPMTPVPEVPAVPASSMQYAVQQLPVMVSDPALEAIMRQVQVGLFALPVQNKGQKDREAAL